MPVMEMDDPTYYRPHHQEPLIHRAAIKADLFHWRQEDEPVGKTVIEIQTCFEPGREPYLLIAEEGGEPFEPSSAATKLTFPKIIEAMFDWSIGTSGNSDMETALAMADYLEMLARCYRRQGKRARQEQSMRSSLKGE